MEFQRTKFAETVEILRSTASACNELAASIIIVNHNGWDDLNRCLQSLQITRLDKVEVLVVDNRSFYDAYQPLQEQFPFVRFIRSEVNLGFGAANNLGAQLAYGRILAFLNPDTVVEPGWLAALTKAIDADPSVGIATSRILLMNKPDCVNACGNDLHISGLALCRGMGKPVRSRSNEIKQVAAASGAAFAMRRDLFKAIGGFDETFFLYQEDTDLSIRVQMAGYRCIIVPESVIYHDYQLNFGPRKTFFQERNRYLMLIKSFHWRTLIVLLPALILSEIITWGFVILFDRSRIQNKLFAYAWALYWWQEIMQKRSATQKIRRTKDLDLLRRMTPYLDFGQACGNQFLVHVAHLIFDPLFVLVHSIALVIVDW